MPDKSVDIHRSSTEELEKCFLLDLPGELRNRIYHFAVEEGLITYFPRRLQKGYTDDELQIYLDEGPQDKRAPEYLGLTQVCRQVRAEYSPMYAARTKIRVFHIDLTEFLNNNFPYMARDADANVIGNLLLECKSTIVTREEEDRWCPMDIHVDILPLLDYCRSRPDLQVEMAAYYREYDDDRLEWSRRSRNVDVLLALAKNPKLQDWLDNTVEVLELHRYSELSFGIKEENWTEWMENFHETNISRDSNLEYRRWLEDTGFEILGYDGKCLLFFEMVRGRS